MFFLLFVIAYNESRRNSIHPVFDGEGCVQILLPLEVDFQFIIFLIKLVEGVVEFRQYL